MKATSILVTEVNENKTQCDCFVTNHIRRTIPNQKRSRTFSEDERLIKDVRSRTFDLTTKSVNVKED
jgi:hypothetical protein